MENGIRFEDIIENVDMIDNMLVTADYNFLDTIKYAIKKYCDKERENVRQEYDNFLNEYSNLKRNDLIDYKEYNILQKIFNRNKIARDNALIDYENKMINDKFDSQLRELNNQMKEKYEKQDKIVSYYKSIENANTINELNISKDTLYRILTINNFDFSKFDVIELMNQLSFLGFKGIEIKNIFIKNNVNMSSLTVKDMVKLDFTYADYCNSSKIINQNDLDYIFSSKHFACDNINFMLKALEIDDSCIQYDVTLDEKVYYKWLEIVYKKISNDIQREDFYTIKDALDNNKFKKEYIFDLIRNTGLKTGEYINCASAFSTRNEYDQFEKMAQNGDFYLKMLAINGKRSIVTPQQIQRDGIILSHLDGYFFSTKRLLENTAVKTRNPLWIAGYFYGVGDSLSNENIVYVNYVPEGTKYFLGTNELSKNCDSFIAPEFLIGTFQHNENRERFFVPNPIPIEERTKYNYYVNDQVPYETDDYVTSLDNSSKSL